MAKKTTTPGEALDKEQERIAQVEQVMAQEDEESEAIQENFALTDEERMSMMTHRQKMAIQNSKATIKFANVQLGRYPIPKDAKLSERDLKEVSISLPIEVKINGKKYGPGNTKVPQHLADSITPIVYRKIKSDLQVFTGKNYRVSNIAGVLSKVEVGSSGLDLAKMVSRV